MQGAEKVYLKMLQEKINYIISGIIEFQLLKRKDEKLSGFVHEGIRLEKVFYYSRNHCTARAEQKKLDEVGKWKLATVTYMNWMRNQISCKIIMQRSSWWFLSFSTPTKKLCNKTFHQDSHLTYIKRRKYEMRNIFSSDFLSVERNEEKVLQFVKTCPACTSDE